MPSSIVLHYFHPPSPHSVGGEPLPDSVALWFGWKGLVLSLSLFLSVWHRCSVGPLHLQQTHKHAHTAPFAREVPCGPWSQTFSGGDFRRERLHPQGSWEHGLACSFWRSYWGKGGLLSSLSLSLDNIRSLLSLSFSPLLAVLVCRSSGADYSSASLVDMSDGLMKPPHSFCFWLCLISCTVFLLVHASIVWSHLLICPQSLSFHLFFISLQFDLFVSFRIPSYLFCFYLSFNLVSPVLYFFLNCCFLICLILSQLSSSLIYCSYLVHSHLSFYHLFFSSLLILPSISLSFMVLSHLAQNLVRFRTWRVSPHWLSSFVSRLPAGVP